jgi:hypothetical protein
MSTGDEKRSEPGSDRREWRSEEEREQLKNYATIAYRQFLAAAIEETRPGGLRAGEKKIDFDLIARLSFLAAIPMIKEQRNFGRNRFLDEEKKE